MDRCKLVCFLLFFYTCIPVAASADYGFLMWFQWSQTVLQLCLMPGSGCCNCAALVYWSLVQLSWQIRACVTGWWLCFRLSLEGRSQILFFTVCTSLLFRKTKFDPWDSFQVEKESCGTRNGEMENNSWIIRNPGYWCSQTCSTSVPFWASTGSKGHWILSNPDMEKGIPY